jgi:hypothetical protein
MSLLIKKKPAIVHKIVFELRYRFGFTYLDRCGRTVNTIMREYPDWTLGSSSPNPQNAPLVNISDSCRFTFNAYKLDLALEKAFGKASLEEEHLVRFAQHVEELTAITRDQLSLEEFSRIGCRLWFLFPFDVQGDAEQWLMSLNCYSFAKSINEAFEGTVVATSATVTVAGTDRKFRIAFGTYERTLELDIGDQVLNIPPHLLPSEKQRGQLSERQQAVLEQQKRKKLLEQNPRFGVMIDVDSSQEDPDVVKPRDFVDSSVKQALNRLRQAIGD